MNKVIDKGFRSCHFVSTIVKHPVYIYIYHIKLRMLEMRENEIALLKLPGGTAQLRTLEGTLAQPIFDPSRPLFRSRPILWELSRRVWSPMQITVILKMIHQMLNAQADSKFSFYGKTAWKTKNSLKI